MRFVRANFFIPDARCFWINPSTKRLKNYLRDNEVDVIITTGPPHSVHLIGLSLKRDLGLKWIADFRDPWTSIDYFHSLPLTSGSREKHFKLEREVLRNADRVVVVSETMKKEFEAHSDGVRVITNGYDEAGIQEPVELDQEFTLTYAGLMNSDRNPVHLWKVLGEMVREDQMFADQLKLRFVGSCSDEVLKSLDKYGLNKNFEFLGYQDHEQVSKYQRAAQVLLLAVNRVPSAHGIVTGKIFEYMKAERPVLAIGPADGDLAAILENTRCGAIADFSDEQGMKEMITGYYRRYKEGDLNVESRGIEKYHRRNLTGELFDMLKEM
jgi:glycosyltransferase involved in cell wall biosynthesis